jgi:hypothetical protein
MKSTVTLWIRPVDTDGWLMAPEVEGEYPYDATLNDVIKTACKQRPHISPYRVAASFNSKPIPDSKYDWTVRKLGASDGSVITMTPTFLRAWAWETKEAYSEQYAREIASVILNSSNGRVRLEEIEKAVGGKRPPILPNTKAFLRMYPEKFFVRTDLNSQQWFVHISNGRQLPTFERSPIDLGDIMDFVPPVVNWDDLKDADSTRPIQLKFTLPTRDIEVRILGAKNLMRPDSPIAHINPSIALYWDTDYDPEVDGARFNPLKRSVVKIGETPIFFKSRSPQYGTFETKYNLSLTADDDLELCQLAVVVMDNTPREDQEGPMPIGVGKFDGEDLATVLGSTTSMTEELQIYPFGKDEMLNLDKEDRKSYGSVIIQQNKGAYAFEIFVKNTHGVRVDTEASGTNSQHYCLVFWNGDEIGRTIAVAEEKESTWIKQGVTQNPFFVTVYPYDFVFECKLEVQVWTTVSQKDFASVKTPLVFIGSATLTGEALEDFLVGDPFYLNRCEKILGMSNNVPKQQRGNAVEGSVVLVGGRAGASYPPEGYHRSDLTGLIPSKKYVKQESAAEQKKRLKAEEAKRKKVSVEEKTEDELIVEGGGTTASGGGGGGSVVQESSATDTGIENLVADGAGSGAVSDILEVEEVKEPGIPPPRIRWFTVSIKSVDALSNSDCDKLVCSAWVGSENLGFGSHAEATKQVGQSSATWDDRNPINSFTFPLPVPHPTDKAYIPSETEIAFKLSIFDVKLSGNIGRHLGVSMVTIKNLILN